MTSEKVDKAWLDVARDAGRQDREQEVHELRAEIERLQIENEQLRAMSRWLLNDAVGDFRRLIGDVDKPKKPLSS